MKEILFRGKCAKTGKWLYGWVFGEKAKSIIEIDRPYPNECMVEAYCTSVIDESTVGQYTGLKDKNGVKIFEGDVLHWDLHWGWYVGYENGAFRKIPLSNIQRINWKHYTLQQEGLDTWEVIGNIHDNPELVEGEE